MRIYTAREIRVRLVIPEDEGFVQYDKIKHLLNSPHMKTFSELSKGCPGKYNEESAFCDMKTKFQECKEENCPIYHMIKKAEEPQKR